MLNLRKIRKIRALLHQNRILKRSKLDKEIVDRAFKQHDPEAMSLVTDEILKMVNGAIKRLRIREKYGYDVMNDFRGDVLTKLFDYSLPKFNPDQSALSTFVFNHVGNHWKNFQNSLVKRQMKEKSLETPVGELEGKSLTLEQTLSDPHSVDVISQQEASQMYDELQNVLKDPRYKEVFRLWVDDTALNDELESFGFPITETARNAEQKSQDISKVLAVKFPNQPLSPVRVNRIIHDFIKPYIVEHFPEEAEWAKTKFKMPEKEPEQFVTEEEPYIPLEQRPAPVYRINPETGERTLISLNLRQKKIAQLKYAQEMWFHTIMTWLSLELNGKLR